MIASNEPSLGSSQGRTLNDQPTLKSWTLTSINLNRNSTQLGFFSTNPKHRTV